MTESLVGGAAAAPLSMRAAAVCRLRCRQGCAAAFTDLERGRRIDAAVLRGAMEAAFGASDATGAWNWKTAYDACEAATVLFLRKFGPAMRARAASPAAMLPMLREDRGPLFRPTPAVPRRAKRSSSSRHRSRWRCVASAAAAITPADVVLEPSAGTGLLAILAELAGALARVSTSSPKPAPAFLLSSFPASP